jgi:UDPglucose--hexose-1-phosphate uridylyltransferase
MSSHEGTFPKSQIRKHYFLDHYVVIAPERLKRPNLLPKMTLDASAATERVCIFCPGHDHENPPVYRIRDPRRPDGWLVNVIKNKYPAVSLDNSSAYGYQEIVVETPEHAKQLPHLSVEQIMRVFDVIHDRIIYIESLPNIRYVMAFKNEGGTAGASIPHAHTQIWGLPFVPPNIIEEAKRVDEYMVENDSCVWCEIAADESKTERHVISDEHVSAFTPYASLNPYEVWIMPRQHRTRLDQFSRTELHAFASAVKKILLHLEEHGLAYNFYLHQTLEPGSQHMHLVVKPRPNTWGGMELGAGLIINPVSPEEAAQFYRSRIS